MYIHRLWGGSPPPPLCRGSTRNEGVGGSSLPRFVSTRRSPPFPLDSRRPDVGSSAPRVRLEPTPRPTVRLETHLKPTVRLEAVPRPSVPLERLVSPSVRVEHLVPQLRSNTLSRVDFVDYDTLSGQSAACGSVAVDLSRRGVFCPFAVAAFASDTADLME